MVSDLLSVIIPTRNRKDLLKRAIISVLSQDWPNIEIIIIDDASSDGTRELLQMLSNEDCRMKYVCNDAPSGGSKARNQGIKMASGVYVAFLDDDDVWKSQKAKEQIYLLKSDTQLSAVTCDFKIFYPNLPFTRTKKMPSKPSIDDLYVSNFLGGASMCLTYRQLLLSVNGFDEDLKSCQDWDLWLKLAEKGNIGIVNRSLVNYYIHKSERISGKLSNIYSGRARIYFNYRSRMTDICRKRNIAAILFIRIMMRKDSLLNKLLRLMIIYNKGSIRRFLIYTRIIMVSHFRNI